MLASQLADLEPPGEEEAFNASIALSPKEIVDQFSATLALPSRTLS
jgi:gluconokinase